MVDHIVTSKRLSQCRNLSNDTSFDLRKQRCISFLVFNAINHTSKFYCWSRWFVTHSLNFRVRFPMFANALKLCRLFAMFNKTNSNHVEFICLWMLFLLFIVLKCINTRLTQYFEIKYKWYWLLAIFFKII